MIRFDDAFIDFSNMGLFVGGENWIHPETANKTHELIFVVKGQVFIEENSVFHELNPGDMICLVPGIVHKGYKKSSGASFFWLHFLPETILVSAYIKQLFPICTTAPLL